MGDVSLKGIVQSYDALLVMQQVVGSIPLNTLQQQVADVSFTAGIKADTGMVPADLILAYDPGYLELLNARWTG